MWSGNWELNMYWTCENPKCMIRVMLATDQSSVSKEFDTERVHTRLFTSWLHCWVLCQALSLQCKTDGWQNTNTLKAAIPSSQEVNAWASALSVARSLVLHTWGYCHTTTSEMIKLPHMRNSHSWNKACDSIGLNLMQFGQQTPHVSGQSRQDFNAVKYQQTRQ